MSTKKRNGFQIHLSTAALMILLANALCFFDIDTLTSRPLNSASVTTLEIVTLIIVQSALVAGVAYLLEASHRRRAALRPELSVPARALDSSF